MGKGFPLSARIWRGCAAVAWLAVAGALLPGVSVATAQEFGPEEPYRSTWATGATFSGDTAPPGTILFQSFVDDPVPAPPGDPGSDAAGAARTGGTEAKPLGRAPEDNRLQFLRTATVLLQPGQWQFDWGVQYAMQERFRPTILSNVLLSQARYRDRRITSPFALRTGLDECTQAFLSMPVGFGHLEVSDPSQEHQSTVFDVGDISGGVNYLLRHGRGTDPDVVLTCDFLAPTGPLPFRGDGTGLGALSDGFWSLGTSLLCIRRFDPIVIYYGIGYRHRFERDYVGGLLTPGEEVNYNFGVGFAVNEKITLSTTLLGAFQTDYWFNHALLPSTSQEPISLRMALTAVAGPCRIIEPYVFLGLTEDAPDVQLGVTITRNF